MELEDYQKLLLDQIEVFGEQNYAARYHRNLSPAGWHLGHCIYTESYWIREQWLAIETLDHSLKNLFVPELSRKYERSERIGPYPELINWSRRMQKENLALISKYKRQAAGHALMQDNFIIHFLAQHYAQHYETLQMIRAQRLLHTDHDDQPDFTLKPQKTLYKYIEFSAGEYATGSDESWHYDNEKPVFISPLCNFRISETPVSNAEYLCFMLDGGYDRPDTWTAEGWQWRTLNKITHPQYWQSSDARHWFLITPAGPEPIESHQAVHGISWHEAQAYARWMNARLPHEYEWEIANKAGKLKHTGQSWEWCHNPFHPYPGFYPFPYAGYSVPYFDNQHYTLKGGSRHTLDVIKRPCFRNYYEADKRHIFAGLRLAQDGH